MKGYGISEQIDGATSSLLLLEEGAPYPALHRLERRKWIRAERGVSENNRRAEFYELRPAGCARFRAESLVWHQHAEAIAVVLRRTSPDLL